MEKIRYIAVVEYTVIFGLLPLSKRDILVISSNQSDANPKTHDVIEGNLSSQEKSKYPCISFVRKVEYF